MENGILPDNLQPKVWMILIGTNDLGYAKCSKQTTTRGILYLAQYLREKRPKASILIHGLLPRSTKGSRGMELGRLWKDIQWINQQLQAFVHNSTNGGGNNVLDSPYYYVDTGDIFLNQNHSHLSSRLVRDGIHPRPSGMNAWGSIIVRAVQQILRDE